MDKKNEREINLFVLSGLEFDIISTSSFFLYPGPSFTHLTAEFVFVCCDICCWHGVFEEDKEDDEEDDEEEEDEEGWGGDLWRLSSSGLSFSGVPCSTSWLLKN